MTLEKQRPLLPRWLTARFARAESGENPAEANIAVVRDGFGQLLRQTQALVPNADFQVEQPITLVTKRSDRIERTLQYNLGQTTDKDSAYYTATVQILDRKWLSRRIWYINIFDDDHLGRYLDITSDSETKQKWEGNRFGMSLMFISDDVVNHLLHHLTQYSHLTAKATIIDDAHGQFLGFKNRSGWTSAFATTLGYAPAARDEFIKWYR